MLVTLKVKRLRMESNPGLQCTLRPSLTSLESCPLSTNQIVI